MRRLIRLLLVYLLVPFCLLTFPSSASALTCTEQISTEQLGSIARVGTQAGTGLIAADQGVFEYKNGVFTKVVDPSAFEGSPAYVTRLEYGMVLFASATHGLTAYSYSESTLKLTRLHEKVSYSFLAGNRLYLVTPDGLFVTDGRSTSPLRLPIDFRRTLVGSAGEVLFFQEGSEAYLLDRGDFRPLTTIDRLLRAWDMGEAALLYTIEHRTPGRVPRRKFFYYRSGNLKEVALKEDSPVNLEDVNHFALLDDYRLLAIGDDKVAFIKLPDLEPISYVEKVGGELFIANAEGLTNLRGGRSVPVLLSPRSISRILKVSDEILIFGDDRLFRYIVSPASTAAVISERSTISTRRNDPEPVAFSIRHRCSHGLNQSDFSLVISDASGEVLTDNFKTQRKQLDKVAENEIVWSTDVLLPRKGTFQARLHVIEDGNPVPIGNPVEIRVAWGPTEHITHFSKLAAPWILAAHTLLFFGLLGGARRSRWCWSVVSDPFWGKFGLWFYFALRHVGILQRWVMDRWFAEVRRNLEPVAYVPMPLRDDEERTLLPDDLPARLDSSPRVWIQGNAGMGKTVLVADLEQKVFGEYSTLFAARKRFGLVPIIVPLRRFASVAPDPKQPELYVAELARRAVADNGPELEDAALFRAILTNSGFVVVLDGANEILHSDAIELSARALHPVRVLVTSQALPAQHPKTFDILRLPPTIEHALQPLLEAFLGEERGRTTCNQLLGSPLAAEVRSGYDVRLLADLVAACESVPELPTDRIGLYDAILAAVALPDGSPYPVDQLCQAAWRMWRDGERRLVPDTHLAEHLCDSLLREHAKVLRTLDGKAYEFRHDQMRGFLAARWAAVHTVDPTHLFEEDETIWQVGRSDQEVVWSFFATMVEPQPGVHVWRWSTREPRRAVLQNALQQRGEREGWDLSVTRWPPKPLTP